MQREGVRPDSDLAVQGERAWSSSNMPHRTWEFSSVENGAINCSHSLPSNFPTHGESHRLDAMALHARLGPWAGGLPPLPEKGFGSAPRGAVAFRSYWIQWLDSTRAAPVHLGAEARTQDPFLTKTMPISLKC